MTRLISRAEATRNSRATLPLVTASEGREVGARSVTRNNRFWAPSVASTTRRMALPPSHRHPAEYLLARQYSISPNYPT